MTRTEHEELHSDFISHNRWAKRNNKHFMLFESFDDYLANRFGKKKVRRVFKEMKVKTSAPKQLVEGTVSEPTPYCCTKPEKKEYTGSYIVGIATMHKSNAVPLTRDADPVEYATMRRN